MSPAVEISLCIIAWSVVILKTRAVRWKEVLTSDRNALNLWLSMLFFAVTLTFLAKVFADFFDGLTANNLSRLIAYSAVSLTLYFSVVASVHIQDVSIDWIMRYIRPLLALTLVLLILTYVLGVSNSPQWDNHHIPSSLPEAFFMFSMYSFALVMSLTLFVSNFRYLRRQEGELMRFRAATTTITSMTGAAYFFVKIVLVGGYFLPLLRADIIVTVSKILLLLAAMMWAVCYLHNRIYISILRPLENLLHWIALKDLERILDRVDRFCPPVAVTEGRPTFGQFFQNPEYYLYRAVIRVLDGKVMLADILSSVDERPDWWDDNLAREARLIAQVLQSVRPPDDFWETIREYRRAGRALPRDRKPLLGLEPGL